MSVEQLANNARSTLAADLSVGATTLVVATPALFPTIPQFRLRIDDELLLVTGVAAGTFTVTRGAEGTIAVAHSNGTRVSCVLTSGALAAFESIIASLVYGSGGDGTCVFDGMATFPFASLAGSVYTLTRDCYLADGSTINAGITVKTAGFRRFCNGTFTVAAGAFLLADGNAASGATPGGTSALGNLGIGMAGGAGHTGVGTGTNGNAQVNTLDDANCVGGAGGAGGAQGGGNGGLYTISGTNGGAEFLFPMMTGFLPMQTSGGNTAQLRIIGGGAGGGGGGADNAGAIGGGGGGGGGIMQMADYNLVNNGTIRAAGGAGAAGTGSAGNAGGGGGGGGGVINSIARFRSGTGTMTAPGGLGGAAFGASGIAGSNGNPGHINTFAA